MLQRIHIRNYAIIDELTVDFHTGLNIITGETGAGKSILMGALGLVLGDRADAAVLFSRQDKCLVEAIFVPADRSALHRLLQEHDLDTDDQLLVRREINTAGKSRSFINDTPVTLQVLRHFAGQMVDLHRQFDALDLADDGFQRNVVDALAGNHPLLKSYRQAFAAYSHAQAQYLKLTEAQERAGKEMDYQQFLLSELEEADFSENELEEAEKEHQLLLNAGAVKEVLTGVAGMLNQGDTPVSIQLKTAIQQLQQLRAKPDALDPLLDRIQSAYIEIKDIADELETLESRTHLDAERLYLLGERINLGNKLLKKHDVQTTADLIAIREKLSLAVEEISGLDLQIQHWRQEAQKHLEQVSALGAQLSDKRRKILPALEKQIQGLLGQMGMVNARLKVECLPLQQPASHGMDEVRFMFDANNTGKSEPLEKVASGGELSRLMLAIKSLVADSMQMPTLIFDEIDTGISGEAARQVGAIMKQLGASRQVIAITHQPQLAARADAHYWVFKQEKDGQMKTGIRSLNAKEQVEAIARMLGGDQPTPAALDAAREMIEGRKT